MKIMNIWVTGMCLWVLAGACTNDNGNYRYSTLNSVKIEGLEEIYNVDQMDTLKIETLKLNFQVEETDELDFEWKVNDKVISTERFCRGVMTEVPRNANYAGVLCVTDRATDLKYYAQFGVKVGTAFSNALFVLSEDADGTALLSMQRRDRENAPLVHSVFEQVNPEFGHLGKKPKQLIAQSTYNMAAEENVPLFYAVCAEGDKKVASLNPQTMELDGYYATESIVGYPGDFSPEYFFCYYGMGMVISEGQLFLLNYMDSQTLYEPVSGYSFVWAGQNGGAISTVWFAYDENTEQFLHLTCDENKDPMLFDQATPLDEVEIFQGEAPVTTGLKYLTYGERVDGYDNVMYPVLWDPASGTAHFYEIDCRSDFNWNTFEQILSLSFREVLQRPNLSGEHPVCLLSNHGYWFFAEGKKIVRFYYEDGGTDVDWYSGLTGEVTAMLFDENQERIFVATYDGTQSRIYELSALNANQSLKEPLLMDGKIVSMAVAGEWTY